MTQGNGIEARLARLERSHRLLFAALLALVMVVPMARTLLGSSQSEPVVAAGAFQLVDARGNVVAELAIRPDGPALILRDPDGRERLRLVSEAEQSGLFVLDESGHTRIGVAQFSHGGGGVALHGPESRGAAVLYLKGTGTLTFYDADGGVSHRVPEE